jgi:hypothetical protein
MSKFKLDQTFKRVRLLRVLLLAVVLGGVGVLMLNLIVNSLSRVPAIELLPHADNRPLEVQVVAPERPAINPTAEFTVISNKAISLEQGVNLSFQSIGELEGKKYYVLRASELGIGDNEFVANFKDEQGQTFKQELKIDRDDYSFPPGFTAITPWDGAEYIINGNDFKAKVDKQNRLLEDYEPADLVDLNKQFGIFTLNNAQLRSEPAAALKNMLAELKKQTGKSVTVASGYRSYFIQVRTYGNWVKELGQANADKVSAKPGHSEHQLGTTVDFVSDETNWQISNKFGDTAAGKWLAQNASTYGFVVPFNQDNSASGGYKEESWHFRYVGL